MAQGSSDEAREGRPDGADQGQASEILGIFQVAAGLHRQGSLVEAGQLYEEVVRRDPGHDGALHFLGLIALQNRQPGQAVDWISKAIAANPDVVSMYCNRATALAGLSRLADAIKDYDRAIALQADFFQAHHGRANLLQRAGRHDQAVAGYDEAIALNPALAEAHSSRGDALFVLKRLEEALASYGRAISLKPDHAEAHAGRGNVLGALGQLDAALAGYDRAIALNPGSAFSHYNRGGVLRLLKRVDEAIASYAKAVELQPDFAIAHHNLATCLLLDGQLSAGFRAYEWRKRCPDFDDPRYRLEPAWSGDAEIAGKTLFIYPELFLGDMIQFGRYALMAEKTGARVILAAPDALHALLRTMSPTIKLISRDASPTGFDQQCALLSLPYAFRSKQQGVTAQVPYLHAEAGRVQRWKQTIGVGGFKIGTCWQGSTLAYALSMQRSFSLAELGGLSRLPNVRLISLQKHDGLDQLANLPDGMVVETLGDDFDAGPDAFLDTAAAMACCDLVLTADTAIAHLAGALGRKTWVALPHVPDWRWGLDGADSPWYPTMRLFRQASRGDWRGVFADVEAALGAELAAHAREVSSGVDDA